MTSTASTAAAGPRDLHVVTLTEYEAGLPVAVAFPPVVVTSLAEMRLGLGWRQFHIAETEKYAHVTYFFNGGVEEAWPGEDRSLIPSPKVATYDLRAGDERGGRHRRAGRRPSRRTPTTSSWPTSPTRTWSATPGSGTATVAACEVARRLPRRVADAVLAARRRVRGRRRAGRAAGHHRRPRQRRRDARRVRARSSRRTR